jgi:hypothetical protein
VRYIRCSPIRDHLLVLPHPRVDGWCAALGPRPDPSGPPAPTLPDGTPVSHDVSCSWQKGCHDRRRGRLGAGSRPKRQPSTAGQKDLTCWSPSPTPSYGPSSGPISLCPSQKANLCPCFLPVNPVDGCEGLVPACRQEIGYFSVHLASSPSVHLVDRRLATEQILRRHESRKPFLLQRPIASRMGEKCQVLWIWSWIEGPGLIKSVPA